MRGTPKEKKRIPKTICLIFEESLMRSIKQKAYKEDLSVSQYFRRLAREDLKGQSCT
jgi:hypothetical protein